MSIWRLNGQETTILGVNNIVLRHLNLADGRMTFTAVGRNLDASYLFEQKQTVTLTGPGGNVRWQGPCLRTAASGMAGAENHTYTVASPWFWLERTVYLQSWKVSGGTVPLGRCILGIKGVNERLTIGEVVTDVINYAESVGCPINAGTIDIPVLFPVEEVKGLMCSEVIQRVLRWAPDAVGWWQFGPTSAKFHCRRRASLTQKSFTIGQAPLEAVPELSPREDIVPSAVVIVYERVDTVDGSPTLGTVSDVAPPGADGRQPFALHYTIPLAGGSVTTLKQPVEVQTIVAPSDTPEAKQYWGRLLGLMGKAKIHEDKKTPIMTFFALPGGGFVKRDLAVVSGYTGVNPYELADPTDPTSEKRGLLNTLPRELIGGAISGWMSGVKAQRQIFTIKVSYTPVGTSKSTVPEVMGVEMVATDATNRIYQKVDSVATPEDAASGLAAKMLAALSTPHYQGTIVTLEEECDGATGLGNVVNLNGGRVEWRSMKAVVQEVQEDIDLGRTTFRVGPPEHLGPADLIELQRCDRRPEGNTGAKNANANLRSTGLL